MSEKSVRVRRELLSWAKMLAIAVGLVAIVNTFFVVNAQIPSGSMEDTLLIHDRLVALRIAYWNEGPARCDIVVFRFPDDERQLFIKRVIGLPGETIEGRDGVVYINGVPLEEPYCKVSGLEDPEPAPDSFGPFVVPEDCYFMMGDNRGNSWDSRFWKRHFVSRDKIVGKAVFKYFPRFEMLC